MIIKTKLYTPRIKSDSIIRSDLLTKLDNSLDQSLTIIAAPAGFGKTHLLACWAESHTNPIAWISLDKHDGNLHNFVTYLSAAIAKFDSSTTSEALDLLNSKHDDKYNAILTSLVNQLTYSSEVILILDDFHLAESQSVNDFMSTFIYRVPSNVHIILSTRSDPNLPLSRMRLSDSLCEIRAEDLRFSYSETKNFLNKNISCLSNESISLISDKVEGWIAGLKLFALSIQGSQKPDVVASRLCGKNNFIFDYLTQEVLNILPLSLRNFMLDSSQLNEISTELCNFVLGISDSQNHLSFLEENNIFLVSLDDDKIWYRYHHLFADVLKVHSTQSEEYIRNIHRRASQWYREQSNLREAVEYASLSKDTEYLLSMLEVEWPRLRSQYNDSHLIDWLLPVQDSIGLSYPVLSSYYGLALLSRSPERGYEEISKAKQLLETEISKLNISERTALGIIYLGDSYINSITGRCEEVLVSIDKSFSLFPQDEYVWLGSAMALRGIAFWRLGKMHIAEKNLSTSVRKMDCSDDVSSKISSRFLLSDFYYQLGLLSKAIDTATEGKNIIESLSGLTYEGCADIYLILAEIYFELGDIDRSIENLDIAQQYGPLGFMPEAKYRYSLLSGKISFKQNQIQEAFDYLKESMALYSSTPNPSHQPPDTWYCAFQYLEGNSDSIKNSNLLVKDNISDVISHTNYFEVFLAILSDQEFRNQVEPVWAEISDNDNFPKNKLIGKCIDLIFSNYNSNGRNPSRISLDPAFITITDNNLTFLSDILLMLLKKYKKSDFKTSYNSLYIVENSNSVDDLSAKEYVVLQWLNTELTGPQIAEKLFISLNTLRTHTKNIYSKLNANNRRSVCIKAQSLGLIDFNFFKSKSR
ncbi:LuxR C-terminal-related transcriptional regulator [Vibrio cidicii]|uniref:LuxR C-terminal-related transcriptional regulator n=1 Tax=Vibrio cidicii TaxID=1763883 RepID=UPI003752AD16